MAIEQEINSNKNKETLKEFKNLLDQDFKDRQVKENVIITGVVTEITKNFIVVDCKLKMEGMIPIEEFKHDKELEKIKKTIFEKFPNEIGEGSEARYIYLKPDNWLEIAKWIQSEPSLLFNSLQCQMGIDMGEDILESRYNFHSMEHDHYLEIRIRVSRSDAKIPSVEQVWRIADWFERETYDMLGIEYTGHRDLRRILLPDDWEGWPLRKDYQEQETYHGIVVPKIKEGWD